MHVKRKESLKYLVVNEEWYKLCRERLAIGYWVLCISLAAIGFLAYTGAAYFTYTGILGVMAAIGIAVILLSQGEVRRLYRRHKLISGLVEMLKLRVDNHPKERPFMVFSRAGYGLLVVTPHGGSWEIEYFRMGDTIDDVPALHFTALPYRLHKPNEWDSPIEDTPLNRSYVNSAYEVLRGTSSLGS